MRLPDSDGVNYQVRGSVASSSLGLKPSPIGAVAAAAVAFNTAAVAIVSAARTVPAKPVSVVESAFVEAWTIPAICIEANRDILDRRKRFDRRLGAQRRAQRRRLDRALDESPCCQHGRRSKSQKTVHRIDPPWIGPRDMDQRGAHPCCSVRD
jgi:hypothetical protein